MTEPRDGLSPHTLVLCFQSVLSCIPVRTETARALHKTENNCPMLHMPWSTVAGQRDKTCCLGNVPLKSLHWVALGKSSLCIQILETELTVDFVSKLISFPYLELIKCTELKFSEPTQAAHFNSLLWRPTPRTIHESCSNTLALHGSTCSMQANIFSYSLSILPIRTHFLFILLLLQLYLLFTTCLVHISLQSHRCSQIKMMAVVCSVGCSLQVGNPKSMALPGLC